MSINTGIAWPLSAYVVKEIEKAQPLTIILKIT